jgi:type I restriction enzyme S subunit
VNRPASVENYKWPTKRLRFLVRRQPTAEQRQQLTLAKQVSFLPMEAIGEQGEFDASAIREKEDVETSYSLFFDGDVVVAKITPCFENGKGARVHGLLNGVGFGTTELHVLTPNDGLDGRFLFYITASEPFRKQGEAGMTGAAGQKRVTDEFIKNFRVAIPSFTEQRAIADFLDRETARLDALVTEKERWLELLVEKRRALITRAVTRGLHDQSIPLMRLKFLVDGIETGFTPDSHNYPAQAGQCGVLKSGCVNGGIFDPNENKLLADDVDPPSNLEVKAGDVLMSRASGSSELIGSVAQVEEQPSARLYLSDKTFRLREKKSVFDSAFFVLAMASSFLRDQLQQIISGAEGLAKNIAQGDIREFQMPFPPLDEQRAIVTHISAETAKLDGLRAATERTIGLLKERRAALIAAAVTGKIEVGQGKQ